MGTFPWLHHGQWSCGDTALVWARSPETPIHTHIAAPSDGVFLIGDMLEGSADADPARELLTACAKDPNSALSGRNGFYVAIHVGANGRLTIGTDTLGLFPLYYWQDAERLVFSTSPGLIRHFVDHAWQPSPFGIAAVLLTMHIVAGQTIWRGLQRLSAGCVLVWSQDQSGVEQRCNPLTTGDGHFGLLPSTGSRLLGDEFEAAVSRATLGREVSIMLSGGLDSRLIAGALIATGKTQVNAVTFGRWGDYETLCSAAVARTLGWPLIRRAESHAAYAELAHLQTTLEQASNSFIDMTWWEQVDVIRSAAGTVFTGFLGDAVMGASHVDWSRDPKTGEYGFDPLLRAINRQGFSAKEVTQLLRADFGGNAADDVVESMRAIYDSFPGVAFQKAWLFDLLHRQRFHVAPFAWRIGFGAWPLMPYADRAVLDLVANLPLNVVHNRSAQRKILQERYPNLARQPLDNGTSHPSSVSYSFWPNLRASIATSRFADRFVFRWRKRHTYARTLDINNPGWHAIRAAADTLRQKNGTVMNLKALDELVPLAAQMLEYQDPVVESSPIKSALGLLMILGSPRTRWTLESDTSD